MSELAYVPEHGFEYDAWHFADQRINEEHDRTGDPRICQDCLAVNPWRDPGLGTRPGYCAACGEGLSTNERAQEFRIHIACIKRDEAAL